MTGNAEEKAFFDRLKSLIFDQEALREDVKMLFTDIKAAGLDAKALKKAATLEVKGTLSKTLRDAKALQDTAERMQLSFDLDIV